MEYINHTIPNPIGAYRFVSGTSLGDTILFVAQGTLAKGPPGGIYALNPYRPYNTSLILGSYGDYAFNSLEDITVYLYNPSANDVRVTADGFGRPNGVKASPDGNTICVSETGAQIGNGILDLQGPRTIYAFDRVNGFLTNRRVFAMPQALASAPDGIKVDSYGNVWAAIAGQGISVWNKSGTVLGAINIPSHGGNLGFGRTGELSVLGGDKIFKISESRSVVGA